MPNNENPLETPMVPQPARSQPDAYYFDKDSVDTVPEPVTASADTTGEVMTETTNNEVVSENVEKTENVETATPSAEVKRSPADIAQERRDSVVNFLKNSKERVSGVVSTVGNKMKNFFGRVKSTSLNVAFAPDAYVAKGYEKVEDFMAKKSEQMANFAKSKIEMAELVASFLKDKSSEELDRIQATIRNDYEALKQFGVDTVEAGADRIRGLKEVVRNKKNSFIISILKSIEEKHRARADKVAASIALLQSI
jgi:predicted transcriptional regulator